MRDWRTFLLSLSFLAAVLSGCATKPPLARDEAAVVQQAATPITPQVARAEQPPDRSQITAVPIQPSPGLPAQAVDPPSTTYSSEYVSNLRACLAGFYGCRREALAGEDIAKVSVIDRERNYSACMAGYSNCSPPSLTPDQQLRVTASNNERNLRACLAGYSNCQPTSLTAEQRVATYARARERNLTACLQGYSTCGEEGLSPDEKLSVSARRAERNFSSCLSGYSACKLEDLSPEQRSKVAASNYERNLSRCLSGSPTCKLEELAATDLEKVRKGREEAAARTASPSVGTSVPTYVPSGPGCAENGSCYGAVSTITGLPKTIAVSGYYRRNGTYVRGHYRSRR
jgi:hypothetical protein